MSFPRNLLSVVPVAPLLMDTRQKTVVSCHFTTKFRALAHGGPLRGPGVPPAPWASPPETYGFAPRAQGGAPPVAPGGASPPG